MECEERALEDFALDKALSENLWNVSEDIVGHITGLGEASIETVKIVELVELQMVLWPRLRMMQEVPATLKMTKITIILPSQMRILRQQ